MNFGSENAKAYVWLIETVDSVDSSGGDTAIAVDGGGYPHISYYDGSASDLKYAKWTGSTWDIQTVDSAGSVGRSTSIVLDSNEYPHISYWDSSNDRLMHANWTGSTWNKDVVDAASRAVRGTSIAIDGSDFPHISYYDSNTHELKYAKWTGSTWNTEIVDDGNNWEAGLGCSIALDISGKPYISYKYDDSDFVFLRYAKWTSVIWDINNVRQIGPHTSWGELVCTSIAIDSNNRPHISYYDNNNNDLDYAKWTGSSWNFDVIDTVDDVGQYNSIALNGSDYAHISYYNSTSGDLKYSKWTGSSWNIETVDSSGDVGEDTSIAYDSDGYIHIGYRDGTNWAIKYAKWTPNDRPISSVDLLPTFEKTVVFEVNATANDPDIGDIIAQVELYYNKDSGSWVLYGTDTTSPFSWNFDTSTTGGDGIYQFYSKAQDNSGLWEDPSELPPASGNNDTWTTVDTTKPTSNVNALPTYETTVTFAVDATASDLYGIAQVELYYKKDLGSWAQYDTDTTSPYSWDFDTSTTGGDGIYQIYSRAQDNGGLWEDPSELPPASGNNDTWTTVDTTKPTSNINTLPTYETTVTFAVDATASDLHGIVQVELYYKKGLGSWALYDTDTTSPYSWDFDASTTGGDGIYQFYSRAQDSNGLWEDPSELPPASGNNDTWTTVDTTKPTSNVNTLPPYEKTVTFAIDASASDLNGIVQVEIHYKKDFGSWELYGTDTTSPFSWNFDTSTTGGDGIYQFYSRAQDNGGLWEDPSELPPASGNNDTWTIIDSTNPTISNLVVNPPIQESHNYVNISADIADNYALVRVLINITYPEGSWVNVTLSKGPLTKYYRNESYDIVGTYQFTIWANDTTNNWAFTGSTFVIQDTTPPTVTNLQPSDTSKTNDDTPTISADYNDGSGIDTGNVLLKVDNVDVTTSATVMASSVIYTPGTTLLNGLHTVYLEVRDASINSNLATAMWSFTVDTTMPDTIPPTITNLHPPNTSTTNDNTPTISADYSDALGINVSSVMLRVDDMDITPIATVTESNVTYAPTIPLSDGPHNVSLHVRDASVNQNIAAATWSFTVDTSLSDSTPPIADAGANREISQGDIILFNGSASIDDNGMIANYTWIFTYDGEKVTLYGENPSFKFENIGDYQVILIVWDSSNNSANDTILVIVTGIDSDNDGLTNYDEINIYGTNPNDPDTDGDGIKDGYEVEKGTNPLVAEPEDEDLLTAYWGLILLIIILIIVVVVIVSLIRRMKRKPEEVVWELLDQPTEYPVIRTVQPSVPPPPPSSATIKPPSPPPRVRTLKTPPPPPPEE